MPAGTPAGGLLDAAAAAGWPATHVIGKDILRFHAVYWPGALCPPPHPPKPPPPPLPSASLFGLQAYTIGVCLLILETDKDVCFPTSGVGLCKKHRSDADRRSQLQMVKPSRHAALHDLVA